MNEEQKAFEAWWVSTESDGFKKIEARFIWGKAWQAAEQAQREKDAAIAESVSKPTSDYQTNLISTHIANAIREQGAGT
jgi:hypothetical protein